MRVFGNAVRQTACVGTDALGTSVPSVSLRKAGLADALRGMQYSPARCKTKGERTAMTKDWIDRRKVAEINRLIERLIVLQTQKLYTLAALQRSIKHRMVQGELRKDDIAFIRAKLDEMQRAGSFTAVGEADDQEDA
jgi:hypothetical protein